MSVADQSVPTANLPRRIPFTVRFSPQFINRLCARLQKSAPPQSDVAGLLFGHSREDLLEVQVFKSFAENEDDKSTPPNQPESPNATRDRLHRMVETLIIASRKDPEVSALELVGWYSFRATGGLHESDVAFHNRYFRQPTEIALILRPEQHPNVLFELYSRSGMTLLSEEEHRWGSLRHATDTTVAGPVDVTMRAKISDDFYLRAYHVGKTLDRAQRRDQWASAVEATKTTMRSLFRSKPRTGLDLSGADKDKESGRAVVAPPPPPLARAAAATVAEPPVESKPAAAPQPVEPVVPRTNPFAPPKPRDREPASPRERAAAFQKIHAGDPPNLPAVIKEKRHGVPWLSSVIVAAAAAGVTFALFYGQVFGHGETPRFLRAIFPDTGLGLRVEGQGDRVLLSWNRRNAVVRSAKEALLHIDDGAQHRDIRLDAAQVENGAVLYRPGSDDVSFRLEIHGAEGASVADTMRVLDGAKAEPLEVKNAPTDVSGGQTPAGTSGTVAAAPALAANQSRSSRQALPVPASPTALTSRAPVRPAVATNNPSEHVSAPENRTQLRAATNAAVPTSVAPSSRAEVAPPPPAATSDGFRQLPASAPATVTPADSRPQVAPTQTATTDTTTRPPAAAPSDTARPTSDTAKVSNWEDTPLARPASGSDSKTAEPLQTRPTPTAPPVQAPSRPAVDSRPASVFVPPRPMKQVLPDLSNSGAIGSTSQIEVAVRVNKKGHVTDAYLVGDSSRVTPRLARAAIGAAKQWTFEPATLRGKTVASDHTIVFEFRPAGR